MPNKHGLDWFEQPETANDPETGVDKADELDLIPDFAASEIDLADAYDLDSLEGFSGIIQEEVPARYLNPRLLEPQTVAFQNARDLCNRIKFKPGENVFALISGKFIFGDIIEGLCCRRNVHMEECYIASLSANQENVDSLRNCTLVGGIDKLYIVLSYYFYSHERQNLVPYIYQELDNDDVQDFQLAFCNIHSKLILFKTPDGLYYTIHGSANLRSCNSIEQIQIIESKQLYDFNRKFITKLNELFATIDRKIGKRMRPQDVYDQAVKPLDKED